jgi:hypothetical protein
MSAPSADAAAKATAPPSLASLPPALVLHIFSLLPVDARARCAAVSRGVRDVLSERSAWARLDLSPSSGVTCAVTDAVLRGAASKAGGVLAALDVSGCNHVTFDALLAVVAANSGELRELCAGVHEQFQPPATTLYSARVEQLLLAAPLLRSFVANIVCVEELHGENNVDARRLLRNEPPFQALRVRSLRVDFGPQPDEASLLALAADVAAHASLAHLELLRAPCDSPAALEAVVDAARACRLVQLSLILCRLTPVCAPALTRLASGDALTALLIQDWGTQLLDAAGAAALGAALRANATLTSLSLHDVGFWHDAHAAVTLLGALTAHRSLRTLNLSANNVADQAAAGAALGALIAADAPALEQLLISDSRLGDAALRPLLEALPANTHLRVLEIRLNDPMSEAFAADVLLPAVRANTSLRTLCASDRTVTADNLRVRAAEALVHARGAAAAAAST